MLQSKKLETPHPHLWIAYHRPEIYKYIQRQVNEYALEKLHEYLVPEATQLLQRLTIMESYTPKPTIYHANYDPDKEEKQNAIWTENSSPETPHTDIDPWLGDDQESIMMPQEDPRPREMAVRAIQMMTTTQRRKYTRFKHKLRLSLQDEYPEYYDPESDDFNSYNFAHDNRLAHYHRKHFTPTVAEILNKEPTL